MRIAAPPDDEQAPMEAAQRMAVQMKAVLDMTPEEHPDRKNLEVCVQAF